MPVDSENRPAPRSERPELEARVERLERQVAELLAARPDPAPVPVQPLSRAGFRRSSAAAPADDRRVGLGPPEPFLPAASLPEEEAADAAPRRAPLPASISGAERWLGRAGIVFVLLAMAFLFKLSVDRGWITPALRLASGFAGGLLLLGLGERLSRARRLVGRVLLGGAVALFYLTSWAGSEVFHLLPEGLVAVLLTLNTLLAIGLSLRHDCGTLAAIGLSGGLSTPWLLEAALRDLTPLYLTLVLLAGAGLHLARGWRGLQAVLVLGGSTATLAAISMVHHRPALAPLLLAAYWSTCALVPLLRDLVPGAARAGKPEPVDRLLARASILVSSAVAGLLLLEEFQWRTSGLGNLALALALGAAAGAWWLRKRDADHPSRQLLGETAALAAVAAAVLLLEPIRAVAAVAALSALLMHLRRRGGPIGLGAIGGAATVAVFLVFAVWCTALAKTAAPAGSELAWLLASLALLVAGTRALPADEGRAAALLLYAGLLGWLVPSTRLLTWNVAALSLSWALLGALVLVLGLLLRRQDLQAVGHGTLALVAGKLLVVDLAQLDAVLRILLFLGFGTGLLALAWATNRPRKGGSSAG